MLPASDWLERADYRSGGVAIVPTAQYSDAVVEPIGERAEEWWILARIEQELGLPSALDGAFGDPATIIDGMLSAVGTTVDELRSLPSNTKVLPPLAVGPDREGGRVRRRAGRLLPGVVRAGPRPRPTRSSPSSNRSRRAPSS